MNPKVKKFLEENPEATMLSFAWSLYWRLWIVIIGMWFLVVFILGMLSELFL